MAEQKIASVKLPPEIHERIDRARELLSKLYPVTTSTALKEIVYRGLADFEREHGLVSAHVPPERPYVTVAERRQRRGKAGPT